MSRSATIFVIRHGAAADNEPNSPLTAKGMEQAGQLADFFSRRTDIQIDRLIASPYMRATQTTAVFAERFNQRFCTDKRLKERDLGDYPADNVKLWEELKKHFANMDLKFPNGESNRDVSQRVTDLVEELLQSDQQTFAIITHRLTMMVLLNHYDPNFGFEQGLAITNPDIYALSIANRNVEVKRIWDASVDTLHA